jgi:15-cis-phytoene synthase/lycopene beta-cyclase
LRSGAEWIATQHDADSIQWIISQSGWGYPPNSIIGKIFHVPIEEHLFFILQPIFLLLLHSLISHSRLLPFDLVDSIRRLRVTVSASHAIGTGKKGAKGATAPPSLRAETKDEVITLTRRPLAALSWGAVWLCGLVLVNEAHGGALWNSESWTPPILRVVGQGFYLGWILVWISPVIALLTYLGARFGTAERLTFILGAGWLVTIDTCVGLCYVYCGVRAGSRAVML